MVRSILGLAVAGLFVAGSASAVNLATGIYNSTGTVASNNGAATCGQVGLTPGAASASVLKYPGIGKTTLTLYVPLSGTLQLCKGFGTIPAGGLNFTGTPTCAVDTLQGNLPPTTATFKFTSTVEDVNSAIGTTTVTIPPTSPLGAGCSAVIDTTIVREGK